MEVYILIIFLVTPSQARPSQPFQTPIYVEYVSASKPAICLDLAQKRADHLRATALRPPATNLTTSCQLAPPLKKEQL